MSDHRAEHGVSQKFEALIIFIRALAYRTVAECRTIERQVIRPEAEDIVELLFKIFFYRLINEYPFYIF